MKMISRRRAAALALTLMALGGVGASTICGNSWYRSDGGTGTSAGNSWYAPVHHVTGNA